MINYMLNGKVKITLLTAGLIKNIVGMSECFPKPKAFGGRVKVESDLSSYTTKADLKNGTGFGISKNSKLVDVVNLKSDVDKLDTSNLKNVSFDLNSLKRKIVPVDLNKLSNEVKHDIVKMMLT